jgi:hypothetical protein
MSKSGARWLRCQIQTVIVASRFDASYTLPFVCPFSAEETEAGVGAFGT